MKLDPQRYKEYIEYLQTNLDKTFDIYEWHEHVYNETLTNVQDDLADVDEDGSLTAPVLVSALKKLGFKETKS